ncbi:MAG: haloacid dehalogenase-like hydrolase [Firmicutes bacterium]|nr:haloacid dehalogenase-like hydrolase [Bacillota bacterium]
MKKSQKLALIYDFDKTLCPKDMQEYSFIPNVGTTPDEFWSAANKLTKQNKMDPVLAYMWLMVKRATNAELPIHRRDFVVLGKDLELFLGVENWFSTINEYGKAAGLEIEHYIVSSGLKEIIEGSVIFSEFKEVFACEFYYDANDVAKWPKNAVNYTTKTQYLFRINKGVLDISEHDELNSYMPEDERPVPFSNMIYIGDGFTDVPCMKIVKAFGGISIAVYQGSTPNDKVSSLLSHERVDYVLPADYTQNSNLNTVVKEIIYKKAKQYAVNIK